MSVWRTVRGIALSTIKLRRDALRRAPAGSRGGGYTAAALLASCRSEVSNRIRRDFLYPMPHIRTKKTVGIFTRWLRNGVFASFSGSDLRCLPPPS